MKNIILFFLLTVLAFSSCQQDPCNDKMCGSYAFCEDGDCKCDPGYEINVNGLCVPSNRCVNGVCPPNFICNNGICVSVTGPCANVVCPTGYICQSGICISTSGPCANVTCGQDSVCDNGTCIPVTSSPCLNVVCGQDSVCDNGNCIPTTGPCANVICPPNTMCVNGNCVSDPCAGINCGNGTCNNGVCDCDPGYEQDANGSCTVAWNSRITGLWNVSDACSTSGTAAYTVSLSASSFSAQELVASNFWDIFNNSVRITMTSPTTFIIPRQEPDGDSYYVKSIGVGTINSSFTRIDISYLVTDETNPSAIVSDSCTSTWIK